MPSRTRAPSLKVAPDRPAAARTAHADAGENGLSAAGRAHVEQIQRARLLAAMTQVVSEHGLAGASVAQVVARAGVSRRTFYELFEDRESCFLAAFDAEIARASEFVLDAYDPDSKWVESIRAGLVALLCFLDEQREAGRLLVVESLGAGPLALEHRRRVLGQIIAAVDEGRAEAKSGSRLPPLTAEGVVGGALSVIHARLLACPHTGAEPPSDGAVRAGEPGGGWLVVLAGHLMSMIVLPYLGPAAARRELERPPPKARVSVVRPDGDPLRELGMRLTYRTVRVLIAVGAAPGASNREVGGEAGIADQGQISKLLTRLARLGLIETRGPTARGAPNAWVLTEHGARVERSMSGGRERAVAGAGARSGR
jgi:AcrR family transcriptional regulator/DNA-binding MarR family transcriptional regulator